MDTTSVSGPDGQPIVVGVTSSGRETGALRFAADVASREGAEVILAHALNVVVPPSSVLMTYAEAADIAQRVVEDVGEEFDALTRGTVGFRTLVVSGHPSRVLVDLAREARARFVVVQHRRAHLLDRLFVGSTANGAAAHCACPVISVPEDWERPAPGGPIGDVVVGVHEGGMPLQALAAAFEWAAASGAPLRVLHAWRLDPAYDDIITARVAAEWRDRQLRELETAMLELRPLHPDVHVEVEVAHQWPTEALVDHSRRASLVVVGRHAHGWAGEHLGSVARTVLREAEGPVMVVPVERHRVDQDWGLDADEVSPQT